MICRLIQHPLKLETGGRQNVTSREGTKGSKTDDGDRFVLLIRMFFTFNPTCLHPSFSITSPK